MEKLTPVFLSLKISLLSTLIVLIAGISLAKVMTGRNFIGKNLLESFFSLPLVLPPTVVGFGLLITFGNYGPMGRLINLLFHRQVVFTWGAAVIASVVVSFPLVYKNARTALESVDHRLEMAARTLGASEKKLFFTVTLPLSRYGILAGLVMAFARGLGEFGATLMLAGNIPGRTQTMPLAIYTSLQSGDDTLAWGYVLIMTVLAFIAVSMVNRWSRKEGL